MFCISLLMCCDVSEEWTSVARRYWRLAGVEDRIELRLRPALETLHELPADELFDIAFIDADKENYINYWDEVLPRIRSGGMVLVDNTLNRGLVVEYVFGSPVSRFTFTQVGAVLLIGNHTISEYLRGR